MVNKNGKFTYAIDNYGTAITIYWEELSCTQSETDSHFYSKIQVRMDLSVGTKTIYPTNFSHSLGVTVYNSDGETIRYQETTEDTRWKWSNFTPPTSGTTSYRSLIGHTFNLDRGRFNDSTYIFPISFTYKIVEYPTTSNILFNEAFNETITLTQVLTQEEQPYITARSNGFTQVQNPVVGYKVPAPDKIDTLKLHMGYSYGAFLVTRDVPIVSANTYTIEFTAAEQEALISGIPTSTSGTIYFYLVATYDGIEYWYYAMPATIRIYGGYPTWYEDSDVSDTNAKTLALTGNNKIFIRYESDANFFLYAAPNGGAWIAEYKVESNLQSAAATGLSSGNGVNLTIPGIDSWPCTATVTDSRGLTNSYSEFKSNYLFIEYLKPTCNLTTSVSAQGEVTVFVSGAAFSGYFDALAGYEGLNHNTIQIEYRYRLKNASDADYSAWTTIDFGIESHKAQFEDDAYSIQTKISGLNYKDAYVFQARVTDKLHTVQSDTKQAIAMTVFDWSKDDFNFNVPVNINGNIYQYNNLVALPSYGTWAPQCNACTNPTVNYGNYMLIGDMCFVNFYFEGKINVEPSQTDWKLYFYGLPYTPHTGYRWQAGGGNCQGYAVPAQGSNTGSPTTYTPPSGSKNGHRFTGWSIEGGVIYGRTQQSYDLAAESSQRATQEAVTGYSNGYSYLYNYQKPTGSFYITALPNQTFYASGTIMYKIDPDQGGVVG